LVDSTAPAGRVLDKSAVASLQGPGSVAAVVIDDLTVEYLRDGQRVRALQNFGISVAPGEFLAIVGPSGCGKSTLLNVLVGTLPATKGAVSVNGAPVCGINRAIGYVTQEDNLLPWRTLFRNVTLPLEFRGFKKSEQTRLASDYLKQVNLDRFEDHYPYELSGGMRQRANIVRALIYDPPLIVMDEPFGSLDAFTRGKMQKLLLDLWEDRRKTVIFITHDLAEAVVLADRVAIMSRRPGTLKAIVDIDLPRPRDTFGLKTTDSFHAHYNRIWALLSEEVIDE
jgi:NitT/TauT family transport system ATP-binding protein